MGMIIGAIVLLAIITSPLWLFEDREPLRDASELFQDESDDLRRQTTGATMEAPPPS